MQESPSTLSLILLLAAAGTLGVLTYRQRRAWYEEETIPSLPATLGTFVFFSVVVGGVFLLTRGLYDPFKRPLGEYALPLGAIVGWIVVLALPLPQIYNVFKGIGLHGLGILVGGLLFGGCAALVLNPTPLPSIAVPPTAAAPTIIPATPTLPPPPTSVPLVVLPTRIPFPGGIIDITLQHTNEQNCSFPDAQFDYGLSISGTDVILEQYGAPNKGTGTYNPDTGEFETIADFGAASEIYQGTIEWDGVTLMITGTYTYIDPNSCQGLWQINGQATP